MEILDGLEHGSYLKRLIKYIKTLRPIIKRNKESVFYVFGTDLALVLFLFGRKFIYEESDLMYLNYPKVLIKIFKVLDRFLQNRSEITFLTSEGFRQYLYDNASPNNVFILPNKLDPYFLSIDRPEIKLFENVNQLRFAFVGLLRYPEMLSNFIETLMDEKPSWEFHIWGDGPKEMVNFVKKHCDYYKNVYYHGAFRNPIDLNQIYKEFDVNFVCYDTTGVNERIAEPNKLYESIYYHKPIMVSSNTYLSNVVTQKEIGYAIDCKNKEEIRRFLRELDHTSLNRKIEKCASFKEEMLIDNGEKVTSILSDFYEEKGY
ncbi:glycosyltransferase [Marinifilum fragile]